MDALAIIEKRGANYILLELSGVINSFTIAEFSSKAYSIIQENNVVVDLNGVTGIDSSGLGILMGTHNDGEESGYKLYLMNPSSAAFKAIDSTGFTDTFEIIHSVTEVLWFMKTKALFFTLIILLIAQISCLFSCSKKEDVVVIQKTPEQKKLDYALDSFAMIYYSKGFEQEINEITEKISSNADGFIEDIENLLASDTDNLLFLIDKHHYVSEDYKPEDLVDLVKNNDYAISRTDLSLRVCTEEALRKMAIAAKNDGLNLLVSSTFRSYSYQKRVYERNVAEMGKEAADRESAIPGTSQHHTGTAIDFGSITDDFIKTKQGQWLSKNASKFGFSLSFPENYEQVTGYRYECWHYRYIGSNAVFFQEKWFNNIQQYMLDFIEFYRTAPVESV